MSVTTTLMGRRRFGPSHVRKRLRWRFGRDMGFRCGRKMHDMTAFRALDALASQLRLRTELGLTR